MPTNERKPTTKCDDALPPEEEEAERSRRERLRRSDEITRFVEEQRRKREWINFAEIAEWCSELGGSAEQDEKRRGNAYNALSDDLLAGDFEEVSKSKVRFLHPGVAMEEITRERMSDRENEPAMSLPDIMDTFSPEDVCSKYLAHCWIPRRMFDRWLAKHELPSSPARFEPQHPETGIDVPPPRRKPGPRPTPRDAVKAFIAKSYPNGVPANVTAKMIARDFEDSAGGFGVSARTVRRALGYK